MLSANACRLRGPILGLFFLWAGLLAGPVANAATYYVDAAAANNSGNGSASQPKKYIGSGVALLSSSGGDLLVIRPGTYSNSLDAISAIPQGTANAWNVIKAETDGTVTIKASLDLRSGNHFTQFEGLKWDTSSTKVIIGRYVKFLRCAFKGGPSSGNVVTVQIGTNDATPGAQYILLEDSWVYGPGGRYKVLTYNSDSVILRRVVVRHDGGWNYDGDNPQAGITTYNSTNVRLQNVMTIDNMTGLSGFESNIYNVGNTSSGTDPGNVRIVGAIVIGGGGNGIAFDDNVGYANSAVEDSVIWGSQAGGFAAGGGNHTVSVNRLLVKSGGTAFADWSNGNITVKNSIGLQNSNNLTSNVTSSFLVAYGNGSNSGGTVLDPRTNGLLYLPRIEDGSKLKTMGESGGQIGPQIVKRLGVSGTLYGDAGFEQVTGQDLWPWPYEDRLKADFSEVAPRGFTATSGTLTEYIWEQLGNPSPIAARAEPSPPTNVQVN